MEKKITKIIMITVFSIVGVLASFFCYTGAYPTTLEVYHDQPVVKTNSIGPLIKNSVFQGEITALYNNLGIMKVRITTFNRVNDDVIRFRIRQKGDVDWYAVNTYSVDRFSNGLLYGFGFPPIPDSKWISYEFEIYSENGTQENAIGFLRGYHSVASQYVFTKAMILKDYTSASMFVFEKIKTSLADPYAVLYQLIFLIPIFFFTFVKHKKHDVFYSNMGIAAMAVVFFVFSYLPIDIASNSMLYFIFVEICIFSHTRVSYLFILGIMCLLQIPIVLFFGNTISADRLSIIIYSLCLSACILSVKELFVLKKSLS